MSAHLFEVLVSKQGYARLEDGTVITVRATISTIEERERLPSGLTLNIAYNLILSTSSPQALREKVKDKPLAVGEEYLRQLDKWTLIDIFESRPASEECRYMGSDGYRYRVIVEAEPTIVGRTMEYKGSDGNPVYHVRWSPHLVTKIEK